MTEVGYDEQGAVDLDGIYDDGDPAAYYAALARLDYELPRHAAPVLRQLIAALRQGRDKRELTIVDLGAGYGMNAAMLRGGHELDDLYGHYAEAGRSGAAPASGARADRDLRIIGVDRAVKALDHARESGLLDAAIAADLEQDGLDETEAALLAGADLLVSTGTAGYVTLASLDRVLEAARPGRPWIVHFALRMFDFEAESAMLSEHGYLTETAPGLYPQRRFASEKERIQAIDSLVQRGIDPEGAEGEGRYFARLHVARPAAEVKQASLEEILAGVRVRPLPDEATGA